MSFFSDIAPWAGGAAGFLLGGPGGAALGFGLGSSLASGENQSDAAREAAQLQAAGGDRALAFQREQYANLAPWRQFGEKGLQDLTGAQQKYAGAVDDYGRLINDPSSYTQSPGYGWLQQQGIDALNRGASASGKLDSGERSKDLMAYGQGLALQDYGGAVQRQSGYLGRLESLMNRYAGNAGIGQTANTQGQNIAGNMGNIAMNQGNAQAGGVINQANARTGMYQNLANIGTNYANQSALNNTLQNMGNTGGGGGYPATPSYTYQPRTIGSGYDGSGLSNWG